MNKETVEFIEWLTNSNWYFDKDKLWWRQYGFADKTTQELFDYWKIYYKI